MTTSTTPSLELEYCDERFPVDPGSTFSIGRAGDLAVDDNQYLHRTFLEIRCENGVWIVANVGRQLAATIGDENSHFVAHLSPGGALPLVFSRSFIRFGAGPTTYEIQIRIDDAPFDAVESTVLIDHDQMGETTRLPATLTEDQRLLVLALAEHAMLRSGSGPSALPSSGEAAARLGWTEKKFNKKLDQVCQKLAKAGVRGLHGEPGALASNRRARLVEYCLSTRMVTPDDLALLP